MARGRFLSGVRLLVLLALASLAMVVGLLLTGPGVLAEDAGRVIRWTARTSLVMFVLAYVARPGVQLWPGPVFKRLLAERKWIGLGFAFSHLLHLGGIIALASPDFGAFVRAQAPTTAVAAFTYLLLFAMAITSVDAVRRAMPARLWKGLHRTGMHFAWVSFAATYGAAIAKSPLYLLPALVIVGSAGVRAMAWMRSRRRLRDSGSRR